MEFHISGTIRHIKNPKTVSYGKNFKKILGAFKNTKSHILKKIFFSFHIVKCIGLEGGWQGVFFKINYGFFRVFGLYLAKEHRHTTPYLKF